MGNQRKYLKIMVNVDSESEQFCHEFCEFNNRSDGFCTLFQDYREELSYGNLATESATHIRLPECIEAQL